MSLVGYVLDQILNHKLDHMLDHMIIDLVTMAIHFYYCFIVLLFYFLVFILQM